MVADPLSPGLVKEVGPYGDLPNTCNMFDILLVPVALLYLGVVGALFVYGVNLFYLTYLALKKRGGPLVTRPLTDLPRVTVQLPVYNELYVVERLIDAAANLDYPAGSLQIQVLDDSTDETFQVAERSVARWKTRGVRIEHLHRTNRVGYKAGALANGLDQSDGEFIALFDADFVPPPDFLKLTLPHFQNPRVAFVQTRWGHLNRSYSLFTTLQALALDAHFMVEQYGRSRSGYWFNFNGTAGIWRRAAIQDSGGWKCDTLTEDLDLSYRAFLRGWKALYLRDVEVKAELPVSFSAYRRQQHRWARGSFECARKLLPGVWHAPISFGSKLQATLHLTGYGVYLLLAGLMLSYPFVLVLAQRQPAWASLWGIALLFNLTTFAPAAFFAVAQHQLGRTWWRMLPQILMISVLGAGMALNTVRAAWQAAFAPGGAFERTPKFGIAENEQKWLHHRYQLKLDHIVFPELAMALLNAMIALFAARLGNWSIAIYAALFCMGLMFTAGVTIAQAVAIRLQQN